MTKILFIDLTSTAIENSGELTATIRLTEPAPSGGIIVMLGSSSPAIKVPYKVKVPAGQSTKTFTIASTTLEVGKDYYVWGQVMHTEVRRRLTLKEPGLQLVYFTPGSINGGSNVSFSVTLDSPAPVGGNIVLLTEILPKGETTPLLTNLPKSMFFASGVQSITITVGTRDWKGGRMPPPREVVTTVRATLGTASLSTTLTVTDP